MSEEVIEYLGHKFMRFTHPATKPFNIWKCIECDYESFYLKSTMEGKRKNKLITCDEVMIKKLLE